MPTADPSPAVVGSCRGCGYPLRGIDSRNCPECGLAYDPAVPRTMNMGRRPGWLARRLMSPIGWPTVLLMFVATAAIATTTRPQEGNIWEWRFALHDLRYFADPKLRTLDRPLVVWTDYLYVAGVAAFGVVVVGILFRCFAGWIARRLYSGSRGTRLVPKRVLLAVLAMALVSTAGIGYGWAYRLGAHWSASREAEPPAGSGVVNLRTEWGYLSGVPDADRQRALWSARRFGDTRIRWGSIALLVEGNCDQGEPRRQLLDTVLTDPDLTIKACAIRLLGLLRHQPDQPLFAGLLESNESGLREAAADALVFGRDSDISYFLVARDFPLDNVFRQGPMTMALSEEIFTAPARDVNGDGIVDGPQTVQWPSGTADKLMRCVVQGATESERNAAAYALAIDAADLRPVRFRYGEWGVWHPGRPSPGDPGQPLDEGIVVQTARAGHPASHAGTLTVDRSLVGSVKVQIADGSITHAYPVPDEPSESVQYRFGVGTMTTGAASTPRWYLRPYPCLPYVDRNRIISRGSTDILVSSGVWWRSLGILNARPSWLAPETLDSSTEGVAESLEGTAWISARGVASRLLRYRSDRRTPPGVVVAAVAGDMLALQATDVREHDSAEAQPDFATVAAIDALDQTARRSRRTQRRGMYVTVAGGKVTAEIVPVPASGKQADPSVHTIGTGKPVQAAAVLREWVIDAGLSPAEADGMLFAWRKPFFETDGKRFILLMSAVDYDSLCPISIQPKPTEMARVGLVWTELGGAPVATLPSERPSE